MKIRNLTYLIVALLATGLLWGCGSSGGGGSDVSDPDGEFMAELVGLTNCVQCHTNVTDDWLEGRHANVAGPDDPRPSLHLEGSSCQPCHNNTYDADNMPAAVGYSLRDVVACESCHGGGGAHRGIGPLPYPKPGVAQCAQCHAEVDETTGELIALRSRGGHTPAGLNVVIDYMASGHADDPRDRSTRSDTIGCNRCHSDEGAKLYAHLNTIEDITDGSRGRGAMPLGEDNISSISCATCHDPHDVGGDKLLLSASADASAQYNTCNHCHAGDNLDLNFHEGHTDDDGLLDRQINDTHYDDPATGYSTGKIIEGYVIRKEADTACADCHNVHSGDNTINDQWARSAHGGFILDAKIAAAAAEEDVVAAGSNDNDGEAGYAPGWAHYDWDDSNGTGPSSS
ncbi:MAG: cytochrome c3 family protein, partial [Pelovirga sp.]